ncbi:oligoendopeptidase, M3 family [Longilinea arvoryzae]|uniref:Oligoendopeptidase, M3 family n=1 Tax=Longilinea arvoryzae TaxID=360412 RepID=A0A0S7BF48_9CHLR|nr:M3 family oligoendopeptidase [Longilinea arvoryzae]GAP12385.1 oligoendopeptidase, M3 family [Longilinea arvoryzae]
MSHPLPQSADALTHLTWADIEPHFTELKQTRLTSQNVEVWLDHWSDLIRTVTESSQRLAVAVTVNTVDEAAEKAYNTFYEELYPKAMAADNELKLMLLQSGLQPAGFELQLRNIRAEANIFRAANLPLIAEEQKFTTEHQKILGAQVVEWEGKEVTVQQLRPVYQSTDRALREKAWRLGAGRQLADRTALNELWQKYLPLRLKMAANADQPDYRAYIWQVLQRFDYTPADCRKFHDAIEKAVVPAARRIYERRRQRLGLDTLRPWDLDVDPTNLPPLRPFKSDDEFKTGVSSIFHKVDPVLGGYFDTMRKEGLLDLENRKNKAPGGYTTSFPVAKRPFIFMNAVGMHDDVQTLLHEGGHSFHEFEKAPLRYAQQMNVPMEFNEVASMGMELLASPYLAKEAGGFYTPADARRARIEHLEGDILFWPYMAVVDAFQHWVYENPEKAMDAAECDAAWGREWRRFMVVVDWSGLEDEMVTGWQRKLHIFQVPFYYVEYGLAQLGAAQVWRNSLKDQAGAVASYRKALALGGTATLPQLYQTAGARLAFDAGTLGEMVSLMEAKIAELEG